MKFGMSQRCRDAFPIRLMCRCLRVSASGYDGGVRRPPRARTRENARVRDRVRHVHPEHAGVGGSPRIWEELRYASERGGRHRVARLMRRAGLQGIPQRRRWRTKPSGTPPLGTRKHLEREFTATAPNTKWVTDLTYIRTAEHWLYRCLVLDVYSGLVVGWAMSARQDRQLVGQAVLLALWHRPARTPVMLHSDRGCQVTPRRTNGSWWRSRLRGVGVRWGVGPTTPQRKVSVASLTGSGYTGGKTRRGPTRERISLITSNAGTIPGSGGDSISSNRGEPRVTQLSVETG
jgi:transposase InsO family protein